MLLAGYAAERIYVMRHRYYTILLATMSGIVLGIQLVNSAPPSTQTTAPNVPIVYSSVLGSKRLTDTQCREIDLFIAEARPKAGEPWFVYVDGIGETTYRATIYFNPSAAAGNVRHGKSGFVDGMFSVELRRELVKRFGGDWPAIGSYVQLLPKPSDAQIVPDEANLPFPSPEGLTDDDLVKVVGIARNAAIRHDSKSAKMPIRNVDVDKDGAVRIRFGWQEAGLNGHGIFVELRHVGPDFPVEGVGVWVS